MSTATEHVNGYERQAADPVEQAKADAIRSKSYAESEALRIEAEGKAKAAEIVAKEEAEKQRLANERARLKLEKDQAAHDRHMAEQQRKAAEERVAKDKAERQEAEEAQQEADRAAEQQRSERYWKWGARGIYAVGLIIAAPVQFLHFWDPERPFLIAAPGLLEGFALVLACGAAWAVAHKRDVAPYRVGIMLGALIAAAINLYGGMADARIGFNAGLIGAIASLGGPIVLMAYEHGIAQKADGIPSFRERRATEKAEKAAAKDRERAKAEKRAAEEKSAAERLDQKRRAEVEQERRDNDRQRRHPDVWEVAESLRSARGEAVVTEAIWSEAWYVVTGSKRVGYTTEIEATARAAQARMKTVTEMPIEGEFSLITSQKAARSKKAPDAPDGRRFNGGTPPRRTPGDTQPYSAGAKKQAAIEQTQPAAADGK
ncbi:MFS transporter [Streptomyces sp. AA1529]|uniref:MFS transporter n=1 Tax=Streptomyces sp. AA1529 TaxID=1203257 RepID=UPI000301798E|nr:MFS transporter [Streptomyces sp. AA1529]